MTLIGAAKEHGIEFIYAISPGLDITFSNQKEVSALKRKLDQVVIYFNKAFEAHPDATLCHSPVLSLFYSGHPFWVQVLRLTFRRHRPQHVPC